MFSLFFSLVVVSACCPQILYWYFAELGVLVFLFSFETKIPSPFSPPPFLNFPNNIIFRTFQVIWSGAWNQSEWNHVQSGFSTKLESLRMERLGMERHRMERHRMERLRITFSPNWNQVECKDSEWKDSEWKDSEWKDSETL
jgi:hypothetical protein